jgi:nicotinamidase-related amidase
MPIFQQRNAANRAAVGDVAIPPRGDAWARIVAALEPRPGELVVNKTTYGTFSSTGLDHALRSLGITALVVGGVVTNVCVETFSFQGPFGRVRTADEVLALLKGGEVSPSSRSATAPV